MDVSYRGIPLDIVDTEGTYRKAVFSEDGCDYLHTLWHIELLITMNEATLTARAITAGLSTLPQTVIDTTIRHPLMQPRGRLILGMNGVPFLITPAPGDATDAANGPFPISFDILKDVGEKTLLCKYVIESRVNECSVPKSKAGRDKRPVILAHRWNTASDIDEDYFTTRTVTGNVNLRSDALQRQDIDPDELRIELNHPIPYNMKRDNIRVELASDNISYNYTFVDSEKPFNLNIPQEVGVTRVEAYETQFEQSPEPFAFALNIARGGTAGIIGALTLMGVGAGTAALHAGSIFDRSLLVGASLALGTKFRQHIFVRVWGHRASRRSTLTAIAMKIVLGRLLPPVAAVAVGGNGAVNMRPPTFGNSVPQFLLGTELEITHDLNGKFVEASFTINRGPAANALARSGSIGWPLHDSLFDKVGNQITTQSRTIQQTGPPPNSGGTRGTYISLMIAQALNLPCTKPPQPELWELTIPDAPPGAPAGWNIRDPDAQGAAPAIIPGAGGGIVGPGGGNFPFD